LNRGLNLRGGLAVAALFFAGLAAGDLEAAPPAAGAPASHVSLRAAPVFGTDAAAGEGWVELVVYVDNAGAAPAKGTLELVGSFGGYSMGSADNRFLARAPFHVQPCAERATRPRP